MITKKFWNTLTVRDKRDILDICYGKDYLNKGYGILLFEYKHDFDFDETGKKLKRTLEHCYLQKDGTVNVTVTIKPEKSGQKFLVGTPHQIKPSVNIEKAAITLANQVKSVAARLEFDARDFDCTWPLDSARALKQYADEFLKEM